MIFDLGHCTGSERSRDPARERPGDPGGVFDAPAPLPLDL